MTISTIALPQIIPNEKQQECIDTLNGPVMVLAGPGTGKTTTVIKRIEHMLNQGIEPECILALTFSEAAANEMKIRLLNHVGPKASSVVIHTYHAFCSDLISQHYLKFELYEDFNVVDDLNKYRLMRESIDEYRPKSLVTKRNDPYFYVPYLTMAIHDIKLNRLSKDRYFSIIQNNESWKPKLKELKEDQKVQEELLKAGKRNRLKTIIKEIETLDAQIKKASEIWDLFEKYNHKLHNNAYIDFDDMINLVLDAFEDDPAFLDEVRSKFKYILVDEYQDTNHSQNELIFKLASEKPDSNIFVVGDDDQIIYAFQGAQINNLEIFLRKYPEAKVICLNENNRSTQTILDYSNSLIIQDHLRLENNNEFLSHNITKKLIAKNEDIIKKDNKVELHIFADIAQENNHIVDRIQSIIENDNDVPLSEIAVLTRTNAELDAFADLLKARNIPYQVSKQKDIFALKPSLLVYLYLKALENHKYNSMGLFGLVAHSPFDFDVNDYTFLVQENKRNYEDFITIIQKNLKKREWKNKENISNFIETFENLKGLINDEKLSNLIIQLINQTGILAYFANKDLNRFENILSIKKMVDEVKAFEKNTSPATLTMLLAYLDNSIRDNISIEIDDNNFIENAVQLITLHKSKGREFSYVFLTNLNAKKWEKRRTMEVLKLPSDKPEFSKESEVARLLFVGCSRAKHNLFLSHSTTANAKNTELSSFIQNTINKESLLKVFTHNLDTESYVNEIVSQLTFLPLYDKEVFRNDLKLRAQGHVMSPSSLYLYNTCPKQFLYAYIYRVPKIDPVKSSLSFGSAVHNALEKFVKLALKNKKYSNKERLILQFKQSIEKQFFPSIQERDIRLNHGVKVLDEYYQKLISTPIENIYGVEINLDLIPFNKYIIKGKIDRIDSDNNNCYIVSDYKTGSPKYKNQIISEEGSHNHYYDQIKFYKLLFELKNPNTKVSQGSILFLEAPDKSVYIDLIDDDRKVIGEKIIETFEKINALKFIGVDEEKQQADACKYCDYKMLCKLNTL